MAKNTEQHATAPQELKALLIVGLDQTINPIIKELYKNTENYFIIGDGIKGIGIDEIKTALKDQNKIAGRKTRVDIQAHGNRFTVDNITSHCITLKEDSLTITTEFIKDISTINGEAPGPECIHLWSCYGGTVTNEFALMYLSTMLKHKLILITHAEDKYSAIASLITPKQIGSIRDYRAHDLTPHPQFIYDLPRSYEAANFVQFEPRKPVKKFHTIRIPKQETVATMINALVSMPKGDNVLAKFVQTYFRLEGERFVQECKNVDQQTYDAMRSAIQDIAKSSDQRIKNFITGTVLHLIYVKVREDKMPAAERSKENINELIIKLLPILKNSGADLNHNLFGVTLLSQATCRNNVDVVAALLENGADPTLATISTPLYVACDNGNIEIARLLLKYGANPNEQSIYAETLSHTACKKKDFKMLELLLQYKADLNIKNYRGTPLYVACDKGNIETAERILMAIYKQKQMAEADGQQLDNITAEINQASVQIPCKLFESSDIGKLEELIKTAPNSTLTIDQEQGIIHYQLKGQEEVKELQEVIAKRRAILDAKVVNVNELNEKPSLQTEAKLAVAKVIGTISHVLSETVGAEAPILPGGPLKQSLSQPVKASPPTAASATKTGARGV